MNVCSCKTLHAIDISHQDEIKASYWSKKQVSMHPTVIYYKTEEHADPHKLVVTHFSDNTSHDAHMVFYFTRDCIEYLKETFPTSQLTKIYIWSDGCSAQYKGKHSFYYLDQLEVDVERNFFGSEHGKGESDAETGLISKKISNAIKSRQVVISNAGEMCDFLCNAQENAPENDTVRIYKLVNKDHLQEIHSQFDGIFVKTLSGKCTRTLHQIKPGRHAGSLLTRNLSCFCISCKICKFQDCENKSYTGGKFTHRTLSSNVSNANAGCNEDSDDEESEDDCVSISGDASVQNEEVKGEIKIHKKDITLSDLISGETFVIISMIEQISKKTRNFVAIIKDVKEEKLIVVNFLKQHFEQKDVFLVSESRDDEEMHVNLDDIVMLLPKPLLARRGGKYFFDGKIHL